MTRNNADFLVGRHGHEYSLSYVPDNTVEATHIPTGKKVGRMSWDQGLYDEYGTINHLQVDPEHQRKGIATAMWNFAQTLHDKDETIDKPEHDWVNMSPDAEAWAASMGHHND
jgi:GNAT superfamily N-acetyltransferase